MSHHFDSQQARENPSLSICDTYIFAGGEGRTVMAMTVAADAGMSSPDVLPDEGLYAFRIDLEGQGQQHIAFSFRFGAAHHVHGDEHVHVQPYTVRRAEGDAIGGEQGDIVVEGETGSIAEHDGVRAFVGVAPELWAADAIAFFDFVDALHKEGRFAAEAWEHKTNFFDRRNVIALVLEVPNEMLGDDKVWLWSTTSLFGHAPEVQVYRWGLPLFTHLYLSDPATTGDLVPRYHETAPSQDRELFGAAVEGFATKLARAGGVATDPVAHGKAVASRLVPSMIPYKIGTPTHFDAGEFNGRPLGTDAFDVMFTLSSIRPVVDGVSPPADRIIDRFPYYGDKFSMADQAGLAPISTGFEA